VEFLKEQSAWVHAGPRSARCTTSKFFWEIKTAGLGIVDWEDKRQAERVLGSMSMYQCRSVSPRDCTLVQFHQLTCFCYACLGYDTSYNCHQADHVQEWKLYRLSPRLPTQARTLYDLNNKIEASTGGEWIVDALYIGDNVVVRAQSEDEAFWILLVTKLPHTVVDAFTDPSGNMYVPRDVVISGFWYERLRVGSRSYLLRNDRQPTSVYTHVVLTSKFSMPPTLYLVKG
jgi:hypothetical protein